MQTVLVIGFIWPEPTATAAGRRILQIIDCLLQADYKIVFVSTAVKNPNSFHLEKLGIKTFNIALNSTSFDELLVEINPTIVLFDRYLTEEQFGWRVADICPNALKILDTEDLHFLRYARQLAQKNSTNKWDDYLVNDITLREIASIYRCDISLIISKFELKLLKKKFKIDAALLFYLPFLENNVSVATLKKYPTFTERKHFMTIGNFKHAPNFEAIVYLKHKIWPLIKKEIPSAEMHVYGAYVSQKALQLQSKKDGFFIKGWIPNTKEAFTNYKVCLAPIQFGAGLKGKLIESMKYGTPSITTTIGSEAMHGKLPWNGFIEDEVDKFAKKAIELYTNECIWFQSQKNGMFIINKQYSKRKYTSKFITYIENYLKDVVSIRKTNFIGLMLTHHKLKSTKYLSKWIEEKNKK